MRHLPFTSVDDNDRRPIDRWIPWMFVGFFVLLIVVLGDFVRIALARFEGVVSDNAYEQGLAYDQSIAEGVRMNKLGWHFALRLSPSGEGRTTIALTILDGKGAPVDPENVYARFKRPTVGGLDQNLQLHQAGTTYEGIVTLPARGVWDVGILAHKHGADIQYHQRVIL